MKRCLQNAVEYRNAVQTDHVLWNGVNSRLCCSPEETVGLYPLLSCFWQHWCKDYLESQPLGKDIQLQSGGYALHGKHLYLWERKVLIEQCAKKKKSLSVRCVATSWKKKE